MARSILLSRLSSRDAVKAFLFISVLALSLFTSPTHGVVDDPPPSTRYNDPATGITFQLFYEPTSGYQYGYVLPTDVNSPDIILRIGSRLEKGGGWTSVGFGEGMNDVLLLVAWPDGKGKVLVAPRMSTGYKVADTKPYPAGKIKPTVAVIPTGTFVNATYLQATFLCGGCAAIGGKYATSDTEARFVWGFAKTRVVTPGNINTLLSDHTMEGEPYGVIEEHVAQGRSADFAKFAALAQAGGAPPATGAAGPAPGPAGGSKDGEMPMQDGPQVGTGSTATSTSESASAAGSAQEAAPAPSTGPPTAESPSAGGQSSASGGASANTDGAASVPASAGPSTEVSGGSSGAVPAAAPAAASPGSMSMALGRLGMGVNEFTTIVFVGCMYLANALEFF